MRSFRVLFFALVVAFFATAAVAAPNIFTRKYQPLRPGGEVVIGVPIVENTEAVDKAVLDALSAVPSVPVQRKEQIQKDDRPALAIVIDDFGPSLAVARHIFNLGDLAHHVTWSILPGYKATGPIVQIAHNHGFCYLIHLPMQAITDRDGSKEYLIGTDTSDEQIGRVVRDVVGRVRGAFGVNNHRGSKATSDRRVMETLAKNLKEEELFFLDSRTSPQSLAYKVMVEQGVPTIVNNLFIDNQTDLASMKRQFNRAVAIARQKGSAVAICHARKSTLPFLRWVAATSPKDVQLVTLEELNLIRERTKK